MASCYRNSKKQPTNRREASSSAQQFQRKPPAVNRGLREHFPQMRIYSSSTISRKPEISDLAPAEQLELFAGPPQMTGSNEPRPLHIPAAGRDKGTKGSRRC